MEPSEEPTEASLEYPAGYEFEPELTGPPPREIPPAFFLLPYHQRRLNAHRAPFTSAVICDVLSRTPGVDQVGMFLFPLQHLFWIGIGLMAAGAVAYVANRLSLGNLEYIRSGEKY